MISSMDQQCSHGQIMRKPTYSVVKMEIEDKQTDRSCAKLVQKRLFFLFQSFSWEVQKSWQIRR